LRQLRNIRAGRECAPARACEQNYPYGGIVAQHLKCARQFRECSRVQRIQHLGPVHRNHREWRPHIHDQVLEFHSKRG